MGSNLCCMKNSSVSEQMPEEEEIIKRSPPGKDDGDQNTITRNSSLKQCLLASPNLNPRRLVNGGDDGDQIKITLKQCLLASPNLNPHCLVNDGELQVFPDELHKKYYPPSPRVQHTLNSPQSNPRCRESPSLELEPEPERTLNSPQTPELREDATLNHCVLSSPEVQTQFFTPRLSFSSDKLGKLGKVDERDEEEEEVSVTSILRRSESVKLKKKVSFRFPEEADIYIFYSVKESIEEI